MGRFGNVMLIAGSTTLSLRAGVGEVIRFFLTNTANTRIFNLTIPGARTKLIGGDSGRYEREAWVDSVLLAPAERAIIDVLFDTPGVVPLQHTTPERTYHLGTVEVAGDSDHLGPIPEFETLHENAELTAERARLEDERRRPPDKTLIFQATMSMHHQDAEHVSAPAWTCPMHPDVISAESGACPHCGMHLVPTDRVVATSATPMTDHVHESSDGLEWEDSMPEMNATTDSSNMIWRLVDAETGHENQNIDWSFRVGDRVKIRLVNTMESDHPMHHPFHVHGVGRFLVIAREDVPEPNLVWKDTVLVRAGETVDILIDMTSPGLWMAHCHIAEHNQDGMMFNFRVSSS
jgi:FtsP/CotA-like multicopper oxidase with cupredoxin domain